MAELLVVKEIPHLRRHAAYAEGNDSMTANTITIPKEHQDVLTALISAKRMVRAAQIIGVSVPTMRSAAYGLPVQRGTAALIANAIAKRATEGKTP
jgi:hypothetical protein